jgi:hypothetical protein
VENPLLDFNDLKNGSGGMGKTRTCWDLSLTVGILFSRWGAQPFIIHPLPFPVGILEDFAQETETESEVQEPRMHPLVLAQSWRQQLDHDTRLTKARIAAREGISRARVTQVMNLLRLPETIQKELQCPPAPLEIHSFSERSLRILISCGDGEIQASRWRELVQELKSSFGT